ncbi:DNA internalization-related competence protein ComEC/Rec2 [Apilactobacillus quenuiae]|uniref:DNA internalization-related competence protein ComEC/Rec2 n=1 Tax=Apilactobacillus quenuiae TaxID=2008377 RepID=UPI000D015183|nr:DNA internalization-related competence protein ComEC/Rec2 [Apilactobacillus quenuiae]
MFFCFVCINQFNNDEYLNNNTSNSFKFLIHPDQIKFKYNGYSGVFKDIYSNSKYLLYGNDNYNYLKSINKSFYLNIQGEIKNINEPTNLNEFNAKEYYQSNNVYKIIYIKKIFKVNVLKSKNIFVILHDFRKQLLCYGESLPKPLNLYFNSLFLGEMSDSFAEELSGVKTLGLIHLFSISGLHVFYIVSVLTMIFIHLRISRERYLLLLMFMLPMFFIIAGASIGLMRSILSVEIGLIFGLFKNKMGSLDIWSITILINLFLQPQMLLQFGCQLSYLLSFGLIYTNKFSTIKQTIMMNLISLPIIIYKLFEWHLLTMIANFIVIPIFSVFVMPIITLSVILHPILPIFGKFTAMLLQLFDNLVNFIGTLPGNIIFGKPNICICFILFLMTLLLIANYSHKKLLLLIFIYVSFYVFIHFPFYGEVTTFDVGQGDSFLIREPFNKSITMIDTGGKIQFNKSNKFKYQAPRTSINYLKSIGINYIDNLVLTHQDADHTGDVSSILSKLKVKRLFIGIGTNNNKNFMRKILPNIINTQVTFIKNDMHISNFPFYIYHPFKSGLGNNEDSIVLGTKQGGINFLFMGDLGQEGEKDIIRRYPDLKADVLKLGHHGSKNSSSDEFLQFIHPKLSIISAGRNNRYNHPNKDVLDKLHRYNLSYFNTQDSGMISYKYGAFGNYWSTVLKGE